MNTDLKYRQPIPNDQPISVREMAEKAKQKTLHNSDVSGAKQNVRDIQVVGNGDMFQLLCKASSEAEGWMKSTKALETDVGCLVQVTTQQRNPDGSYAVAESLAFVPCMRIVDDVNDGCKLELNAVDLGIGIPGNDSIN
jgi:hypothetical protein